jgi:hypothetical protein
LIAKDVLLKPVYNELYMKRLKALLNALARWIVVSSINPSEVSLTIKGVLVGTIPTIMFLLGVIHLNVGQEDLNLLIDSIAAIVQLVLALVAVIMTALGLLRKLLNTFLLPNQ